MTLLYRYDASSDMLHVGRIAGASRIAFADVLGDTTAPTWKRRTAFVVTVRSVDVESCQVR